MMISYEKPSSEIFETFDRLLLMTEGRTAFLGNLILANDFFKSQGFECPNNYNPSDFFIKTLAITPEEKEKCQERVNVWAFYF